MKLLSHLSEPKLDRLEADQIILSSCLTLAKNSACEVVEVMDEGGGMCERIGCRLLDECIQVHDSHMDWEIRRWKRDSHNEEVYILGATLLVKDG